MTDDHASRLSEARAANAEAERRSREVQERWPEVRSIAEALRVRRQKNNFAAMIAAAMRGPA